MNAMKSSQYSIICSNIGIKYLVAAWKIAKVGRVVGLKLSRRQFSSIICYRLQFVDPLKCWDK